MLYKGSFVNEQGRICSLEIETGKDSEPEVEIGGDGIYFESDEPIALQMDVNELTDVILRQSGTVRLQTDRFLSDLFRADFSEATVEIKEDDSVVFRGFVLPRTYSQEFNSCADSLDINIVDRLTALQWRKWRNIGTFGTDYNALKNASGMISVRDVLILCLSAVGINFSNEVRFLSEPRMMTGQLARFGVQINEQLFFGESEDKTWTLDEVVTEVLRYLNLHIADIGGEVIIFDWQDLKNSQQEFEINLKNAYGCDSRIEVGEIYNRFCIVCDMQENDEAFRDPLDDEDCTSPYPAPHHYMRQYNLNVPPPHNNDYMYFGKMLWGLDYPDVISNETWIRDYWIRVLENPGWTFFRYDESRPAWDGSMPVPSISDTFRIYGSNEQAGVNEWSLPERIRTQNGAGLLEIITGKQEQRPDDNSVSTETESSRVMVIHVGGDGYEPNLFQKDESWDGPDAEAFRMKCMRSAPRAVWTGGTMHLSPSDSKTTRYLDISGKITLVPVEPDSAKWSDIETFKVFHPNPTNETYKEIVNICGTKKKGEGNKDEEVAFMSRFFRDTLPVPDVNGHSGTYTDSEDAPGFHFYTEGETLQTKKIPDLDYARITAEQAGWYGWGTMDQTGKVGVLICALTVGDKCLCERGEEGVYQWEEIQDGKIQTFTIGFDVKPGDYLMGKEYPIVRNMPYTKLLDFKGTAIPIKESDHLHGEMKFTIIGPAFMRFWLGRLYNSYNYKANDYIPCANFPISDHPLYIISKDLPYVYGGNILRQVESIWLSDFNIKLVSDNAGGDPLSDCDIVYTSETDESYSNVHDEITFRICSDLTDTERTELGVADTVRKNTAFDTYSQKGVMKLSFYDNSIKPEQYYVDSYYSEYSKPKVTLTQTLRVKIMNPFCLIYRHPAITNALFATGFSRNIKEGSVTLNLREIK